ncbi:MAG: hypothetical protein RLZZ58_1335 [Pseudomonadota bacterium]
MRQFITAATAIAVTMSTFAIVPAAQARHRNSWGYRHHDRVDAGDVIGGLLILGTIAAIANSGDKRSRERDRRSERYEPPYRPDDRRDDRNAGYDRSQDRSENGTARTEAGRAADACAWAAEGQLGPDAHTTAIDRVLAEGDGWSVSGRVENGSAGPRGFQCTFRAGRVSAVSVEA